jgi:hypothetical protein
MCYRAYKLYVGRHNGTQWQIRAYKVPKVPTREQRVTREHKSRGANRYTKAQKVNKGIKVL